MQHLNSIVQLFFQKISSSNILCGTPNYKCFGQEDFHALTFAHFRHLSETETEQMYCYLREITDNKSGENGLNVFRALKELVKELLTVQNSRPLCRYEKILQWHELTMAVGEDLPVCAFLALRTELTGSIWRDFEWSTVIGHDNMQLNRMMQRGLSDNHFHLFGSAPSFLLIWMKLMNELDNHRYAESLRALDQKKRMPRVKYTSKYHEESLEIMHFQAALIRAVLFYYIDRKSAGMENEARKVAAGRAEIQRILENAQMPVFYGKKPKVQMFIDRIKIMKSLANSQPVNDYTDPEYGQGSIYYDFAGERAFLYQMLLGKIGNEKIPDFMMNWFYAYLVIKMKLREELVQVNPNVGFENFSEYSRRKSGFLFTGNDDKKMVQHAVMGSLASGNIRSLELRISPCATAEENRKWIRKCDQYIRESGQVSNEQMEHIYYVLHFPKQADSQITQYMGFVSTYRHFNFRNELERKAEELLVLRENFPEEARRVRGIDACSQEIGCRPEVFAPVFRRLSSHVAASYLQKTVNQWKITYHVGEDWMDFTDGLRAVDEAVLFLNLKNGDRLGHATVLGLNVKQWYRKKCCNVCLPLQDYIDNIVWLYHKLIEFDIKDCETLKGFLQSEYEKNFLSLYHKYLHLNDFQYDIDTYYEAWKLRGDHPALYRDGQFSDYNAMLQDFWQNHSFLDAEECRHRKETVRLVYFYHYSAAVRFYGKQAKDFSVPDVYINGVEKVQKAMQLFIAERGISIEANPSSNYYISTMDSYQDHPISRLYNMGLTADPQEIKECTQMHISINTDDKGVFQTSLENEYALMSCALERAEYEDGRKKYQKQLVYEWMDHIRENGNQQSFLQD